MTGRACFLSGLASMVLGITLGTSGMALAHDTGITAPVPEGGIAWEVLEETQAVEWVNPLSNTRHLRPEFSASVEALDGKSVLVSGFMMPLDENSPSQKRFLLFKNQPDCWFHMTAGPTNFIDVRTDKPLAVTDHPLALRGTFRLVRAQSGGIFYQLENAEPVELH